MTEPVTAALLIIGNEILSGRTRDTNLPFLAKRLNDLGVRLVEARIVRDETEAIVAAVNALRAAYTYVLTTGGIGPTHDDITAAAIARAFGVPLERNAGAVAAMAAYYAGGALELNEARLRMADMPRGAVLIDNPVSGAPGFQIENVFVLAGVPRIMQAMVEGIRHRIVGGAPVLSRTVAVDLPEGTIADTLEAVEKRFDGVEIGSYPYYRSRRFGVKLVLRSTDRGRLADAAKALIAALRALGGEAVEETAEA